MISSLLKNKYTSNTLWLLIGKGVEMIITMIVGIMVARYLTEYEFGIYNYALSIVTIFAVLSNLGLANIVTKDIVNDSTKNNLILGSAFLLKIIGAICSILLIILAAILLKNSKETILLIGIASIPILIKTIDVISYFFDAKVLSKFNVFSKTAGVIFSNLLKLITVLFNLNVIFIYFSLVIDAFIFVLFLFYFYKKKSSFSIKKWEINKSTVSSLFSRSWPLMFTGIIYVFYLKIDQIMIKELIGPVMLGHYSAAVKLSSAWYTIPWLITSSIFPALLNALKKSEKEFESRFITLAELLFLLAFSAIIPISFLSDWIIELIYAGKYSGASEVLTIHIWSSIFIFIGYAGSKWLIAKNLQKIALINMVIGALFNFILNFIFIPKYGISGAAYITLISQAITFVLMPFMFTKSRRLFTLQIKALLRSITIILPIIDALKLFKKP